jgi:predicted glutamine amidotransferase
MCLIIHADTAHPQDKEITAAAAHNRDGIGVAYYNPQTTLVEWIKGLDATQAIEAKKNLPLPAIYHFRLATHGGTSPLLCHPFPITRNVGITTRGEAREVLFHNGIWTHFNQFVKKARLRGAVSDTRIMAWALWKQGQTDREQTAKTLADESGRLAIFSGENITTYGDWTEGDPEKHKDTSAGCWYSNLTWCFRTFNNFGVYPYYGRGYNGQLSYVDDWDYEDLYYVRSADGKYSPRKKSNAQRLREAEPSSVEAVDCVDPDGFLQSPEEPDPAVVGGKTYYMCQGCDEWKERMSPQELQFLDGREELCRGCNLALQGIEIDEGQGIEQEEAKEEPEKPLQSLAAFLETWDTPKLMD